MDRAEPLWRPVCEGEEEELAPSPEGSKPSASKPSQGETSPPSPRTLKAIQDAMNDSSDEERVDMDKKDGNVSPRTILAIQQVLTEEEDGAAERRTPMSSSSTKLQANIHHPVPQVVMSSSDEETELEHAKSLPNEKSDVKGNSTGRSLHVKDSLFVSSSEDEMEEVIGQRNKALHLAVLQQPHERKSEEEARKGELTEDIGTGSRGNTEKQEEQSCRESEHGVLTKKADLVQPQGAAAAPSQNTLSINLSVQVCAKPLSTETEIHPVLLEQGNNKSTDALEERTGEDVKSEVGEESESEGKRQSDQIHSSFRKK